MRTSEFSILGYVTLNIEPVIHDYHCIKTRNISLSLRRHNFRPFAIAGCKGTTVRLELQ